MVSLANLITGQASVMSIIIGICLGIVIYLYSTRLPQFMMLLDILFGLSLCILIFANSTIDNSVKSKFISFSFFRNYLWRFHLGNFITITIFFNVIESLFNPQVLSICS